MLEQTRSVYQRMLEASCKRWPRFALMPCMACRAEKGEIMGFLDHLFGKKEEPMVIDLEIFNERLASAQEPLEPDALYSSDQAQRNIVAHRLNQRDQVIDTLSHLKRAGHQTYDDPVKGLQVKRR